MHTYKLWSMKKLQKSCLQLTLCRGLYSFNHFPFRCEVALSVFENIMDNMLAELYLNGILTKDETFEQYRLHGKEVFKKFGEFGFKLGVHLPGCNYYSVCDWMIIAKKNTR